MTIFESRPEFRHVLDSLIGSQTALVAIMADAEKNRDPSLFRVAIAESKNLSKACVRLLQGLSSYQLANPGEAASSRPAPPTPDPEFEALSARFLAVFDEIGPVLREAGVARLVTALTSGTVAESA